MSKKKLTGENPSQSESHDKKPGRPWKYKPDFDQMLIEHMAKGYSFESFGAIADVCEDTLFHWAKTQETFKIAKDLAFIKNRLYWEKQGIEGLYNITEYENGKPSSSKVLNSTVWIFNMKNRFKWRDKQDEEVPQININVSSLSDEDLLKEAELAAQQLKNIKKGQA